MNEHQLLELTRKGEGLDLEFKTCRDQISRDVYETVCAFLNRNGGTILLGVQDSGEVAGINANVISQIKKDFVTAINKPHGFGVLNPATFTPLPKNPVIGAFFREIHRADEFGSGMRRMMRYGKAYGSSDPEMIEGDVF